MDHVLVDGECTTCNPIAGPHQMVNGECSCGAEPLDGDSAALLAALNEIESSDVARAAWDPAKHARNPKGSPGGGKFRSMVDRLKDAITEHQAGRGNGDHPFHEFDREQLRKVAKARGIELKRGESRDSISAKLLGHLGGTEPKAPAKAMPKKVAPRPSARPRGALSDRTLGRLTDEQIDNGIKMHGADSPRGKQLVEEKRQRAESKAAALAKVGLTHEDVAKRPAKKATPALPGLSKETPKSGKKKLDPKYLSEHQTPVTTSEDRELHDSLAAMFEYHDPKTGFRTVLDRGAADFGDVEVRLNILDKDGNKVGTSVRHISEVQPGMEHFTGGAPAGSRVVEHSFFALDRRDPPIQGGGFATRWLAATEEEYRANDIHSIMLHADIDVGGYAWAKMGFDFKHPDDAKFIAENDLKHQMALTHDPAVLQEAQKLLDRLAAGDTPMPVEFAMLGWAPGKTTWLGKQAMLGSDWQGIKRL